MNKLIGLAMLALFPFTIKVYSQTTHIEAENWSTMSGVQTTTTQDAGGGLVVGWIDPGDWMEYSYTAPATGTYNLRFRLATSNSFAQLQIKDGATVLGTVDVPVTGSFETWQTVTGTVSLAAGTHTLRVVSSGTGKWNFNWWELDAPAGATNQAPTVSAGPDQTTTLPANSVQLSGSATDPDGSIASTDWLFVSGPGTYTFSSTTALNPTVSNLVQGSYTFRLKVTDNSGASSNDDVVVNVNPAPTGSTGWSVSGNAASSSDFIGTTNNTDLIFKTSGIQQAKINTSGEFWARKIKVTQSGWADYVFDSNYILRPLAEVECFISQNKHLPDVPAEADVEQNGLNLGDNQAVLLRKVEELTLYIIQQDKKISELQNVNRTLEQQNNAIKDLTRQLDSLKALVNKK